jgi:hypothetical protein
MEMLFESSSLTVPLNYTRAANNRGKRGSGADSDIGEVERACTSGTDGYS